MENPRTKSLFREALDNTLQGLWRKLPWFFAAVAAMLFLTALDSVRTNYDIRAGSAGRPIEISDEFLTALKPESITKREKKPPPPTNPASAANSETEAKAKRPGEPDTIEETLWKWLNEPYRFRYQKFANRRALLDALAVKAMVVTGELQAPLRKQKEETLEKLKGLEEEVSVAKAQGRTPKVEIDKDLVSRTNEIGRLDNQIAQLDESLVTTTKQVYYSFADSLPKVLLTAQHRKLGMLDDLLSPILDEQSSLNVVYQVFRLTALIVLILSFVFILVMLIQHTPFAGETETVSSQLKTLISLKSAGIAGEIAKTAIISVTALGVGTAVFVGATAPATSAVTQIGGNPGSSVSEKVRERFRETLFPYPEGQTVSNPVAEEYFLQTLLSERNRYSYFYDLRQFNNGPPLPVSSFNPTILPAPVEVRTVVIPDGSRALLNGSQALLTELRTLVTKVNSASDLTQIKLQIAALQADLTRLNAPDCQCKDALSAIASKLEALNTTIGGNASQPSPRASPTPSSSPATASTTTTASPALRQVATPRVSILGTLKVTAEALDAIAKDLKATRADNLIKLGSSSRNLGTRTGQLFGSEYYFVSDQTYLALEGLLKGSVNYNAITTALTRMKQTQPPLKKDEFLRALRGAITKAEQEAIKPWEKVILNYARLHR